MKPAKIKTKHGIKVINPPKKHSHIKEKSLTTKHKYVAEFLNSLSTNDRSTKPEKKTIAFVLRKSKDYDVDYLEKIITSMNKYVNIEVEYVCLSDVDVSKYCKWLKFEYDWTGWWSKLELFSHPHLKGKSVVYFDLDTVIKGDITDFVEYNHIFTGLKGFIRKRFASGLMAWSGDYSHITKKFKENPKYYIKKYIGGNKLGDQDFINNFANVDFELAQDIFPGLISSNKLSTVKCIRNSHIVCFHGNPRPRDVNWKCRHGN